MFLTIPDLSVGVPAFVRDLIASASETIILENCMTAEAEIESYLSRRYHIRPELEKQGPARHKLLLQIARDIAIYNLYQLTETIPAKVEKRRDNAISLLKDIAKGDVNMPGVAAAPPAETGTPEADLIGHGSRPPRAPLYR